MAKVRLTVPTSIKTAVLSEFNHRCAICGAERPQVHHIDEDPANNEIENLLPLCPNCHLSDQHRPTEAIQPRVLALFRRHKDPAILSPQFLPLFRRFEYLYDISETSDHEALALSSSELTAFVRSLEMGSFYGAKLAELTEKITVTAGTADFYTGRLSPETAQAVASLPGRNRAKLLGNREAVIALCVELLRYQGWSPSTKRRGDVA